MALLDLAEARTLRIGAGLDLERSVQVAVLVLSAGDQIHQAIAQVLKFRIIVIGQCVGGLFQPLVHIGVLEDHAVEVGLLVTGHHAQIAHGVAPFVGQRLDLHAGGIFRNINALLVVDNGPLVGNHFLGDILPILFPEWRSHRDFRDHAVVLSFIAPGRPYFAVRMLPN